MQSCKAARKNITPGRNGAKPWDFMWERLQRLRVMWSVLRMELAEREGFEPSVEFPLHTLSKRAPSTTRTSLRFRINAVQRSATV
jgi:hypothetical protein